MIKLTLPFWLSGKRLATLKDITHAFYTEVETWLRWPLTQFDVLTCTIPVLNLIAWQRDIIRFTGETERLYRLRVKHAFINLQDAGSTVGLLRILLRLEVGYVEIEERLPGRDWDIITIRLNDSQLAANGELLRLIVQYYGRTCRRYEMETLTRITFNFTITQFSENQQTVLARL